MNRNSVTINLVLLVFLTAAGHGCGGSDGPKLARVYGTITLGGKPLTSATIQFVPEQGRPSLGITDKSGKYELGYAGDRRGAVLGKHQVRISTLLRDNETGNTVPEAVPDRYNVKSELNREVKAGKNEFNFELDASGPISQPSADD